MDNDFLKLYIDKLNEELGNLQRIRVMQVAQIEYLENRVGLLEKAEEARKSELLAKEPANPEGSTPA